MFNLLKKKCPQPQPQKIKMELINVKRTKEDFNCFIGKFVSIDIDEKNDNYYLSTFDDINKKYIRISGKIENKYYDLCENYNYGLIYSLQENYYQIAIICKPGYLKRFDIELNQKYEDGASFIIENNNLIDKNKIVGEIKRNTTERITLNVLDNGKLVCFIEK